MVQYPTQDRSRSGFTLIELIVVLVIVGLMTAAVVPSFTASVRDVRMDRATRDVIAFMKSAQESAIADLAPHRFCIEPKTRMYWIMRSGDSPGGESQWADAPGIEGEKRTLPEGITLSGSRTRRDRDTQILFVTFYPSGACDYATIELLRAAPKRTVTIDTKGRIGQLEVKES